MTENIKRDITRIKKKVGFEGVIVPDWKRRHDELEPLLKELDERREAIQKERSTWTVEQRTAAFIEDQRQLEQWMEENYDPETGTMKTPPLDGVKLTKNSLV